MNGDQQRQRKAVRDELAQLVEVFEVFTQKMEDMSKEHSADLSRVNRRLVDLQMNLDAAVVEACNTDSAFQAFKQRGFWSRVNWLVTGR